MLGGDPRKESISFVLTARFYDGDPSNDRGGSQNVSSGNAMYSEKVPGAGYDPMQENALGFRVDTAVHIPRVTWNRRFLPAMQQHLVQKYRAAKAQDFYVFGEVAASLRRGRHDPHPAPPSPASRTAPTPTPSPATSGSCPTAP